MYSSREWWVLGQHIILDPDNIFYLQVFVNFQNGIKKISKKCMLMTHLRYAI